MIHSLASMPVELVQAIFGHVTAYPDAPFNEHAIPEFDPALDVAPYRIASVCTAWRTIALRTPELWTYISIPWELEEHDVDRLNLNMERSGHMPLVIVGIYDEPNSHPDYKILEKIWGQVFRWRRVRLHVTEVDLLELGMLDLIAPLLEEFVLTGEYRRIVTDPTVDRSKLLSISPQLQRLACTAFTPGPPPTPWAHLDYLMINMRIAENDILWEMLSYTPVLRDLQVFFPYLDAVTHPGIPPSHDIVLPRLERLALYGHASSGFPHWSARWKCPSLHTITASTYGFYMLGQFFAHFARQIRVFKMQYEPNSKLSDEDALALVCLADIQELEICATPFQNDEDVALRLRFTDFWQSMRRYVEGSSTVLHKLRRIKITGLLNIPDDELSELDQLVQYMEGNARANGGTFFADGGSYLAEWRAKREILNDLVNLAVIDADETGSDELGSNNGSQVVEVQVEDSATAPINMANSA